MKATTKRAFLVCILIALLVCSGFVVVPSAYAVVATLPPDGGIGPQDEGLVPRDDLNLEVLPQTEETTTGEEPMLLEPETPTVPATEPPSQGATPSAPTTETTRGAEATPTLPGTETELPFTGGRPIGFWVLGAVLGIAGATTIFMSAMRQRRSRLGTAAPLTRAWIPYTTGTVLLLAGLAFAAYPSFTDLRYLFLQRSMAAEGQGQEMPKGAVARIVIPGIDLDAYVLEGTEAQVLDRAPGHYPDTPLPGETGNSAIAGHRTMFGHPFNRLNELRPGDEIRTATSNDEATYRVVSVAPVSPSATEVAGPFGDDRLTLTTCHPIGSARQRLVAVAVLEQ
ncbi:MAG: class E sortase [Coriobacteriales bacterium]|nr:class E sortase [Coriobacteriales bacterium]